MKKKLTIGILAHVDAGKTTLSEALLYRAGVIRTLGRVDHKNAYLDTFSVERERGITIFSKQARFSVEDCDFILLDTPGHVDFSAEAERTLALLDYAILVVSATDGVQNHTRTLWHLLELYNNTSDDGGWPLQISEGSWASEGKFLNCLNGSDEAYLYYTAEAGTYNCTVYYRSGDSRNSLEWYDDDGKIERSEVSAGANDQAGATHQATFTIKVLVGGDGCLKFSGGQNKGPQLDRIVITKAG